MKKLWMKKWLNKEKNYARVRCASVEYEEEVAKQLSLNKSIQYSFFVQYSNQREKEKEREREILLITEQSWNVSIAPI